MQLMTGSLSSESPPRSLDELNKLKSDEKKEELFKIFVYNKEHDQTVAVTLRNRNTKIQSILTSIVNRKNGWAKDRYFLINVKDEQILNPERTLSHYHVANESVFILTRKNFRSNGPASSSNSNSNSSNSKSISHNGKTKEKLTIVCSFGAPYDQQKLVSSYFGDASLNQYALKIKEKFGMPRATMITFRCAKFEVSQHGVPFLGKHRQCGLKELDIHANDEVIAQTNGVNLTLKPFHAPGDSKGVEMFCCFTLNMLRDQIEKELGIALKDQRWLLRNGGRLIRDDKDCGDITEYETITILRGCGCEGRDCGHLAVPAIAAAPTVAHLPTVQTQMSLPTDIGHFTDFSPAHAQLVHPMQTALSALPTLTNLPQCPQGMMTMLPPTVPSSMYALASQYPHYARMSEPRLTPMLGNLGDYAKWAPLVIGDHYVNAYGNVNTFEEQKDFDQFDAGYEFGRSARLDSARALKPCRHGNRCRFFLNPHISGPCHFYHPPSTTTNVAKNFDAGSGMCMPAAATAKRRTTRNRAKNY